MLNKEKPNNWVKVAPFGRRTSMLNLPRFNRHADLTVEFMQQTARLAQQIRGNGSLLNQSTKRLPPKLVSISTKQ